MVEFELYGITFSGDAVGDAVIAAWEHPEEYTISEIAEASGFSRQWVSTLLSGNGLGGRRHYPELEEISTFDGRSDVEIAQCLRVAESRITSARLRLGIKYTKPVDMQVRRWMLTKYLFGRYLPGPAFVSWVRDAASKLLTQNQAQQLEFYLSAARDPYGKKRHLRYYAKKKLKAYIEYNLDDLLEKEVIYENGHR